MRAVAIWKSLSSAERRLTAAAIALFVLYGALALLSPRFDALEDVCKRPVWSALGLMYAACAAHLYAVRIACRCAPGRRLLFLTIFPAVAFRLLLVGSVPILENDLYRYIWDGNVAAAGVSPYRYSPQQVLQAEPNDPLDDELAQLIRIRNQRPGLRYLLEQVSHPDLPTIYPPVSQWFFECAANTSPQDANADTLLVVMKVWMTLFDLGTLGVLIAILRRTENHVGWSVAWGWCPLVLKEFANSGHLDSIAIFLTTSSLYCAVGLMFGTNRRLTPFPAAEALLKSAIWLGLAVGAKLYAIVLLPMLALSILRRLGRTFAMLYVLATVAVSLCVLQPMWIGFVVTNDSHELSQFKPAVQSSPSELPPIPLTHTRPQNPSGGLTAFLSRWEMNDFLFLLVVENLRVHDAMPEDEKPWFVLFPTSVRRRLTEFSQATWALDAAAATFRAARAMTLSVFIIIVCVLAVKASRANESAGWLESAFLTLAWFWLLAPTQFPWYWCWALVLVPYARGRAWFCMSACSLYYYTRFWLTWHNPTNVWGTPYDGWFFYFYVANWIAYAPWFAWLVWEATYRRRIASSTRRDNNCGNVIDFTERRGRLE